MDSGLRRTSKRERPMDSSSQNIFRKEHPTDGGSYSIFPQGHGLNHRPRMTSIAPLSGLGRLGRTHDL